jgi:hypothetical protein
MDSRSDGPFGLLRARLLARLVPGAHGRRTAGKAPRARPMQAEGRGRLREVHAGPFGPRPASRR